MWRSAASGESTMKSRDSYFVFEAFGAILRPLCLQIYINTWVSNLNVKGGESLAFIYFCIRMAIPGRKNFDQHSTYIYICHQPRGSCWKNIVWFNWVVWLFWRHIWLGVSSLFNGGFLDSFQHQPIINWNSRNKSIWIHHVWAAASHVPIYFKIDLTESFWKGTVVF